MSKLDEIRNLIPHQSLEAYAFPIVVRAFKKYGFPSSLAKIDSKKAGRLSMPAAAKASQIKYLKFG